MDALEASVKLAEIDKRIEALLYAYKEMWNDFDSRWSAIEIEKTLKEYQQERDEIADKLRSVRL